MDSQLVITSAASGTTLLTVALRREAVGLKSSDSSQDAALLDLDERVAAAIVAECCISIGSGAPPTLLQETLTETFRLIESDELVLSRRHNILITTVTVDDVTLADTDYVVDQETGILTRLCNDWPSHWCGRKIVVVYQAGFPDDAIPADLMQAAMDFMRLSWNGRDRDPSLKSEVVDIPDVRRVERQYWIGSVPGQAASNAVPDIVAGQLVRYRNSVIA